MEGPAEDAVAKFSELQEGGRCDGSPAGPGFGARREKVNFVLLYSGLLIF